MSVLEVIGQLMTPCFAAAINPIAIILVMLLLVTERRAVTAPAYTTGYAIGSVVLLAAVVALTSGLDAAGDEDVRDGIDVVRLGLAALFAILAVRTWKQRPRDGAHYEEPKYFTMVGELSTIQAFGVGVAIATVLNPKNIVIEIAAGGTIGETGLSIGGTVVVIVVFVIISMSTIVIPVVAALALGERALPRLETTRAWLAANHTPIMLVLFVVLAARYLGQGLALFD